MRRYEGGCQGRREEDPVAPRQHREHIGLHENSRDGIEIDLIAVNLKMTFVADNRRVQREEEGAEVKKCAH